jgi:hypothetical protein
MDKGQQWTGGSPNPEALSMGEIRFHEADMPEETAYQHSLTEYGTPRRIHAIDPFSDKSHRITKSGHLEEHPEGTRGLVGYADVYRGSDKPNKYMLRITNSDTGETTDEVQEHYDDTNVGWMTSAHPGVGRGLMEYLHSTTPEKAQINLGKIMHPRMGSLADQMNKKIPGRVRGKNRY